MQKRYYSYEEFKDDIKAIYEESREFNPDTILAIARGGLCIMHFLANFSGIRRVYSWSIISYDDEQKLGFLEIGTIPDLKDSKRVLIVDDIVDSGDTAKSVLEILKTRYPQIDFKLATIFWRPTASISPDFFVKESSEWIDFFWEVDLKRDSNV